MRPIFRLSGDGVVATPRGQLADSSWSKGKRLETQEHRKHAVTCSANDALLGSSFWARALRRCDSTARTSTLKTP